MRVAESLIREVEARGGRIAVDQDAEGEWLVIEPPEAGEPVLDQLVRYKAEIIELLNASAPQGLPEMPPGVRLVSWHPLHGPVWLTPYSTVTNTDLFIRTTLVQLGHQLAGYTWLAGNWGVQRLLDRLRACGCEVEIMEGA